MIRKKPADMGTKVASAVNCLPSSAGRWPAQPVSPQGLDYDPLYGRSANQERLIGSAGTQLHSGDWVFLRPAVSEGLLADFSEIRLLRRGQLVGRWSTIGNA